MASSATHRAAIGALWLALLAAALAWALAGLQISGDLRRFLPAAQTAEQRLMLQQVGEGAGARLLLIALSGGEPEQLAERSRALRAELADAPELLWIGNGEDGLDAIPDALQDYRYLISPGPASGSLTVDRLQEALQQRLQDLASPAAAMVAPLIARDPTLESLRLAEAWSPPTEPQRVDGVWLSADLRSALLLAQTRAPGFDPEGQRAALARLRDAHLTVVSDLAADGDNASRATAAQLEISGPGAFAERIAQQTSGEASQLGGIAGGVLLLVMALAYRRFDLPLYAGLPLASGVVAGLLAVSTLFGELHGITLAFGFTLLGVAVDYPVHLLSHRRPGEDTLATARAIWPTLATGAASSCLAYLIFLFAGVDALRQLAAFTVAGLATAALTTRYLLPRLLPEATRDSAAMRLPTQLQQWLRRPWPRWPAALLALVCVALLLSGRTPWWNDDLGALTPVPAELLARDRALRAELGAPDVRWLLVLHAADTEQALQASEQLRDELDALATGGVFDSIDYAARYLPSAATQRARQAALPEATQLAADLQAASAGLPFKPTAFAPFLAAVEQARALPPLTVDALADTPLALRIAALLQTDPQAAGNRSTLALFTISGLQQPQRLSEFAAGHPQLELIDLKATAQSLAAQWRQRVLTAMAVAGLLLVVAIRVALGDHRRAARVLLPVALGTLAVLATLQALAIPLTLFHLVSLVLAAGLGVDYALFFERSDEAAEQRRTLHALLVCALSTLLVFALLATSQIPVLRAIGLTVTLGVLFQGLLAVWLARPPLRETAAR